MQRRWTVGALSELLGIAAPTLRTWERRYGIGPTYRTAGGHRRYTIVDADRVATMSRFIAEGVSPREAAELVQRLHPHDLAAVVASGDEGLRTSAREYAIIGILKGALAFDGQRVQTSAEDAIERFGLVDAWDSTIVPALVEVGRQWADGGLSVAAEHLVSARILEALRASAHSHPVADRSRVVLATTEEEQHKLPVVALGAALAERGIASTELGSRLPLDALEAFVDATEPSVVFLWSSVITPDALGLRRIAVVGARTRLLLGGPAWPSDLVTSHTLAEAVEHVQAALADELR